MPARVGFKPTFFRIILEFGTINPAAIKYAADEISPQTSSSIGLRDDLAIETDVPETFKSAPMNLSISSV